MKARHVLVDGRPAPALWVRFVCPACHRGETLDAYLGVALHGCTTPATIMVAERIVGPLDRPGPPARGPGGPA